MQKETGTNNKVCKSGLRKILLRLHLLTTEASFIKYHFDYVEAMLHNIPNSYHLTQ